MDLPIVLLGSVALLFVIYFVVVPLVVWNNFAQQVEIEVIPFDPATTDMPPDVRAQFADYHTRLTGMGFQYFQTISLPRFQRNIHQVMACYGRPKDLVLAQVMALHTLRNGQLQPAAVHLFLSTRLDEDGSIATSNFRRELLYIPNMEHRQFPEDPGVEMLCRIHEATLARKNIVPNRTDHFEAYARDAAQQVRTSTMKTSAALARTGQYILSRDGAWYSLSVSHAFVITWQYLPPTSWIRQWLTRRRARAYLEVLRHEGRL